MFEWFSSLAIIEQILWIVSIIATVLFFFQMLSTVINRNPDRRKFTIASYFLATKNFPAFFSMFGWVSISCLYQGFTIKLSLVFGIISGIIMLAIMAMVFYFIQKLKLNESPEPHKDPNPTGEVIHDIGKMRSSLGKIRIKIDGILKEIDAMTDFEHDIKSGTKIKVESVMENGIFIIKPLQ